MGKVHSGGPHRPFERVLHREVWLLILPAEGDFQSLDFKLRHYRKTPMPMVEAKRRKAAKIEDGFVRRDP